jgi:HAD superfamily hydrolase (TIGR01509 family)
VDGWEVYFDVIPTLEALTSLGMPLAIVSNWPPTLETTLDAAGIRRFFSVIVSSGVVGYAKPRPEIFRCALDHLKVDASRALYVGDSVPHDLYGARTAGLQAVLLDRTLSHADLSPRIERLEALVPLVQSAAPRERPNPGCC